MSIWYFSIILFRNHQLLAKSQDFTKQINFPTLETGTTQSLYSNFLPLDPLSNKVNLYKFLGANSLSNKIVHFSTSAICQCFCWKKKKILKTYFSTQLGPIQLRRLSQYNILYYKFFFCLIWFLHHQINLQ